MSHQTMLSIFKSYVDNSSFDASFESSFDISPDLQLTSSELEVIERMRRKNTKDPNVGLKISAEVGCVNSLMFFRSIGATDIESINSALMTAAEYGRIEIVKLIKEWGVADGTINRLYFDMVALDAAYFGHIELLKLIKDWGFVEHVQQPLEYAADQGHFDIVKLLIEWDPSCITRDAIRDTIITASMNDNVNIIKNFKEWGLVDDLEEPMEIAAELGYMELVKLCKEYGAVKFDDALQAAIRFGECDVELLKLFREWKVDVDLDKAIQNVINDDEIKDFLIEWKASLEQ